MKNAVPQNGAELLNEFMLTACDSPQYVPLIEKLTDYVGRHKEEMSGEERLEDAVRQAFVQAFVTCVHACQAGCSEAVLSALRALARWLKNTQKVRVGEMTLTVGEAMKDVEQVADMKGLRRMQRAETGSGEQKKAVQLLIDYCRADDYFSKIPFLNVRAIAEKALLNTYVENANHYPDHRYSSSRDIMHMIAAALPRSLELPGSGMTLWEFEDRIEPTRALEEMKPRLESQKFTDGDVACIDYYMEKWPDFDLGGQSFREVAFSFAHAMLVLSANELQRARSTSEQAKWKARLNTCMQACAVCPEMIPEQERKTLREISKHFDLDSCGGVQRYNPPYPPISDWDYFKRKRKSAAPDGKKGLFARLRGKG